MNTANIIANTGLSLSSGGNPAYFVGNLEYSGYYDFGAVYNRLYGYFYGPEYNEIAGIFELTATSGADGAGFFAAKR